jgi:Cupin domain
MLLRKDFEGWAAPVSAKKAAEDAGGVMDDKIDLSAKLASFSEHWSPRTVAQFNECDVTVVKVKGEFVWHKHDDTDDFFLVLKGTLDIQLRDRTVTLGPGQIAPQAPARLQSELDAIRAARTLSPRLGEEASWL